MRVIISSLLLVLALHFLLQGINYRKHINLTGSNVTPSPPSEPVSVKQSNENFESDVGDASKAMLALPARASEINDIDVRQELLNSIQCKEPPVVAANKFVDDKNDSNFQSNVLNVNRFYKKNVNDTPAVVRDDKPGGTDINSFSSISQYSNQPITWNYKNEMVMNGGELLTGVTGYDNLIDQYFSYGETSLLGGCAPNKGLGPNSCSPPTRGAMVNDDLRMGLGTTNIERRSIT
jgi:hypothetical protein